MPASVVAPVSGPVPIPAPAQLPVPVPVVFDTVDVLAPLYFSCISGQVRVPEEPEKARYTVCNERSRSPVGPDTREICGDGRVQCSSRHRAGTLPIGYAFLQKQIWAD